MCAQQCTFAVACKAICWQKKKKKEKIAIIITNKSLGAVNDS